jgi:hypothetical protein
MQSDGLKTHQRYLLLHSVRKFSVSMMGRSLFTRTLRVLLFRAEGWPPVMEGSCEYIEQTDKQTRGVSPFWGLGLGIKVLTVKIILSQKF